MCSYNEKETLSTLQFGQRAKCIKNKVTANVERSAKELERLLEIAEMKIKEYEHIIKNMGGDHKHMITLAKGVTQELAIEAELKQEELIQPTVLTESVSIASPDSKASPKPKKKKCYTIGTQTDPLPEPEQPAKKQKKPVEHEEMDMLEGMNSEEELAYLQKMEEEAMQKLEEEEIKIKTKKEQEKKVAQNSNHVILEIESDYEGTPDPVRSKKGLFPSSRPSIDRPMMLTPHRSEDGGEKKEDPKGHSETAYIAQTLQLVDKNLELKKLKEDKAAIEEELEFKKQELEELRDKMFESNETLKDFQATCRIFAQQMKISTEGAMLDYQEKTNRLLKLGRELDELNLKLIYISNDNDLKCLSSKTNLELGANEGLSELSKLVLSRKLH